MVGYERGSTARTAGSDATLRAGAAGSRTSHSALACSHFCVGGAGRHALCAWLLRVRTTGAPARSVGVPTRGSHRSVRFARPERVRLTCSSHRRAHRHLPRRRARALRRARPVPWASVAQRPRLAARPPMRVATPTEAPDKTRAEKGGSSVPSRVLAYAPRRSRGHQRLKVPGLGSRSAIRFARPGREQIARFSSRRARRHVPLRCGAAWRVRRCAARRGRRGEAGGCGPFSGDRIRVPGRATLDRNRPAGSAEPSFCRIRPELQVQRFKSPPNHEVEFAQVNARRLRVTRKDRRVVSGIKHNAFSRVF